MPDDEFTTWTLADIQSSGMELEGKCISTGCTEFARFNVGGLISRFGGDWRVPKILPVRCTVCGQALHFQLAVDHDPPPAP